MKNVVKPKGFAGSRETARPRIGRPLTSTAWNPNNYIQNMQHSYILQEEAKS